MTHSRDSAIKKVKNKWLVIARSMKYITSHPAEFTDEKIRTNADGLLENLEDWNFVLILHFLIDILEV